MFRGVLPPTDQFEPEADFGANSGAFIADRGFEIYQRGFDDGYSTGLAAAILGGFGIQGGGEADGGGSGSGGQSTGSGEGGVGSAGQAREGQVDRSDERRTDRDHLGSGSGTERSGSSGDEVDIANHHTGPHRAARQQRYQVDPTHGFNPVLTCVHRQSPESPPCFRMRCQRRQQEEIQRGNSEDRESDVYARAALLSRASRPRATSHVSSARAQRRADLRTRVEGVAVDTEPEEDGPL